MPLNDRTVSKIRRELHCEVDEVEGEHLLEELEVAQFLFEQALLRRDALE